MKKVLLIAFHFPPCAMGSGHLRTLGFARYLPEAGWQPYVLSARAGAYPRVDAASTALVPEGCAVQRAFALDAKRAFGSGGRYPGFLARPDRWVSWQPAAVWHALRSIRRERVDAIWSTYPVMTAHAIAWRVARRTGLPWVADFRDPVRASVQSADAVTAASQLRWERRVLDTATRVVLTTPGAARAYAGQFPAAAQAGRLSVIGNGYDEALFADLPAVALRAATAPVTLLHSGTLYPDGRNPLPFLEALAGVLAVRGAAAPAVRLVLRASTDEPRYQAEVDRLGLSGSVTLAPAIGNRDALLEQARADALLLFQGTRFDAQIPAKVYEYLRIGRPIFALAGPAGDTAALLRGVDGAVVVPPDDVPAIQRALGHFLDSLAATSDTTRQSAGVERWSRRARAQELAQLLDAVSA